MWNKMHNLKKFFPTPYCPSNSQNSASCFKKETQFHKSKKFKALKNCDFFLNKELKSLITKISTCYLLILDYLWVSFFFCFKVFFFFFKVHLNYTLFNFYLFIFGCVGSSFLCEGFLQLRQAGATLHRGARASHYPASLVAEHMLQTRRLSSCGSRA